MADHALPIEGFEEMRAELGSKRIQEWLQSDGLFAPLKQWWDTSLELTKKIEHLDAALDPMEGSMYIHSSRQVLRKIITSQTHDQVQLKLRGPKGRNDLAVADGPQDWRNPKCKEQLPKVKPYVDACVYVVFKTVRQDLLDLKNFRDTTLDMYNFMPLCRYALAVLEALVKEQESGQHGFFSKVLDVKKPILSSHPIVQQGVSIIDNNDESGHAQPPHPGAASEFVTDAPTTVGNNSDLENECIQLLSKPFKGNRKRIGSPKEGPASKQLKPTKSAAPFDAAQTPTRTQPDESTVQHPVVSPLPLKDHVSSLCVQTVSDLSPRKRRAMEIGTRRRSKVINYAEVPVSFDDEVLEGITEAEDEDMTDQPIGNNPTADSSRKTRSASGTSTCTQAADNIDKTIEKTGNRSVRRSEPLRRSLSSTSPQTEHKSAAKGTRSKTLPRRKKTPSKKERRHARNYGLEHLVDREKVTQAMKMGISAQKYVRTKAGEDPGSLAHYRPIKSDSTWRREMDELNRVYQAAKNQLSDLTEEKTAADQEIYRKDTELAELTIQIAGHRQHDIELSAEIDRLNKGCTHAITGSLELDDRVQVVYPDGTMVVDSTISIQVATVLAAQMTPDQRATLKEQIAMIKARFGPNVMSNPSRNLPGVLLHHLKRIITRPIQDETITSLETELANAKKALVTVTAQNTALETLTSQNPSAIPDKDNKFAETFSTINGANDELRTENERLQALIRQSRVNSDTKWIQLKATISKLKDQLAEQTKMALFYHNLMGNASSMAHNQTIAAGNQLGQAVNNVNTQVNKLFSETRLMTASWRAGTDFFVAPKMATEVLVRVWNQYIQTLNNAKALPPNLPAPQVPYGAGTLTVAATTPQNNAPLPNDIARLTNEVACLKTELAESKAENVKVTARAQRLQEVLDKVEDLQDEKVHVEDQLQTRISQLEERRVEKAKEVKVLLARTRLREEQTEQEPETRTTGRQTPVSGVLSVTPRRE